VLGVVVNNASVISALSEESADLSPGFWHGPDSEDLGVPGPRSYPFLVWRCPLGLAKLAGRGRPQF
jgi:hypothetical protein